MIVYGYRVFRKVLAQWQGPCHVCNQLAPQGIVRDARWVTIFWIPLFPIHIKRSVVCAACGTETRIDKAQALRIASEVDAMEVVAETPATSQLPPQN